MFSPVLSAGVPANLRWIPLLMVLAAMIVLELVLKELRSRHAVGRTHHVFGHVTYTLAAADGPVSEDALLATCKVLDRTYLRALVEQRMIDLLPSSWGTSSAPEYGLTDPSLLIIAPRAGRCPGDHNRAYRRASDVVLALGTAICAALTLGLAAAVVLAVVAVLVAAAYRWLRRAVSRSRRRATELEDLRGPYKVER